jgi:hypothetical protein
MLDIPEFAANNIHKHPDFGELSRGVSSLPGEALKERRLETRNQGHG